ncbi:MAG: alpha/beta hydrolase [Chloroflexi bacterium]|nr:MAG: alpha/beta hydrolase [Chloroflexota bacterium]RLC79100.1 MAG: alpha/beta hydrolase [Chloroflexota bacterium]
MGRGIWSLSESGFCGTGDKGETMKFLSYLSAFLGVLTLIRLKPGWATVWLWGSKLLAGALTPFLALAGSLGALLGLARKDRKMTWAGLFGAAVAVRHVINVTAPHDGFARAFGANWQSRIPPELRSHLLPKRYTPIPADPPKAIWQRDVVIGSHVETSDPLLADVWQPPDGTPRTGLTIIYLHGSAWAYLDKDMGTRRFFRHLTGQGHVVVDLAYTLAPKAQLLAMVADVKRAIAWLKINAAEYGVNPERIVLMGGSAGGHLSLLAAYTPNHPELQPADVETDTSVRAVVSYYGPPDLRATHDHFQAYSDLLTGKTRLERMIIANLELFYHRIRLLPPEGKVVSPANVLPGLLGGAPDDVPELYRLGSPINHIGPHCPPTLLLQGDHDLAGMLPDVRRLHRALREAGVASVYVEFPDTDHAFDLILPKWAPTAQAATYDTERFLALMV